MEWRLPASPPRAADGNFLRAPGNALEKVTICRLTRTKCAIYETPHAHGVRTNGRLTAEFAATEGVGAGGQIIRIVTDIVKTMIVMQTTPHYPVERFRLP